LTAMCFLTEMGDLTRFHNRRQVAAYLGLCPASFETGEASDRKGHITRQGPSRVRKVLCQAAWTGIRVDEATRTRWERIKRGSPRRGKKATVALMRTLGIQMWHRALYAGVAIELVAAAVPPPRWIDWIEAPPAMSQAG
jgi:transposase